MKGRAYHPDGKQYTWNEVLAGVDAMHRRYARAGYGHGDRVAILFHQRPEFFFHYFALNALGCSVVPINPDYRVDEIAYALDHSEARLALAIETRLEDVRAAARLATAAPAVAAFDDSNDPLPEASVKATLEKPGADTKPRCFIPGHDRQAQRLCPEQLLLSQFRHMVSEPGRAA